MSQETDLINNIECVETFDRATNESFGCRWTLQLTDVTVENFTRDVFPHIEIPLMQGEKRKLADGRTEYRFDLENEMSRQWRKVLLLSIMPVSAN